MELLLLGVVLVAALFLIPLGLPGTWVMVGAALLVNPLTGADRVGVVTIVGVTLLALVGEVLEFVLSGRYARKYGGSRRAGWGAIIGSIVGAIVGVPVPVLGSIIGGFLGAFVGAFVAERSLGTTAGGATRVATGALLGRGAAAAMKTAIGVVIAVGILIAAGT